MVQTHKIAKYTDFSITTYHNPPFRINCRNFSDNPFISIVSPAGVRAVEYEAIKSRMVNQRVLLTKVLWPSWKRYSRILYKISNSRLVKTLCQGFRSEVKIPESLFFYFLSATQLRILVILKVVFKWVDIWSITISTILYEHIFSCDRLESDSSLSMDFELGSFVLKSRISYSFIWLFL